LYILQLQAASTLFSSSFKNYDFMDFLFPPGYGPVTVLHEVPAHYLPYRMAAAVPYYAKGRFGDYLTQIITGSGFSIQFNIFTILVAGTCLYPYVAESLITLHFMLQGDICCILKGFGQAWLHEGAYHLFYIPGGVRHEARFDPAVYHSFHLDLSSAFLPRLAGKYPELQEVAERLLHHSAESLQQHAAHITQKIIRLIEELKHCPYEGEPDRSWYEETRLRELLLLYVQDRPAKDQGLSIIARRMKKVKYYLDYHLKERLTLSGVAAHFNMKQTTFKKWFAQYFGKSFHHYLLERRMDYAKELLRETGKTLLEIAGETGYSDAAGFSHAFMNYMGQTPGEYRNSWPQASDQNNNSPRPK